MLINSYADENLLKDKTLQYLAYFDLGSGRSKVYIVFLKLLHLKLYLSLTLHEDWVTVRVAEHFYEPVKFGKQHTTYLKLLNMSKQENAFCYCKSWKKGWGVEVESFDLGEWWFWSHIILGQWFILWFIRTITLDTLWSLFWTIFCKSRF